jgi:presenilin-like A22 family membrane protease
MAQKKIIFKPAYWGIIIFIIAEALTLGVVAREDVFLEANNIYVPSQPSQAVSLWPQTVVSPSGEVTQTAAYSSLGPILIYFFAMVIILGAVLFLIPISALKSVFRALFAFLFSWGVFIVLIFWLPLAVTIIISVAVGFIWFLANKVWLHNLVMVLAMVSLGAVFGRFISPWTAMILLLVLAVYDILAVRFGYMLWMANKMGDFNALPAFAIPCGIRY